MISFTIGLVLGALLVFVGMSYRHNQLVDQIDELLDEADDRDEGIVAVADEPRRFVPDLKSLIHLQNAQRDQQRKDIMGKPVRGQEREAVRQNLRRNYEAGASVRQLAAEAGYSYGRTHKLLEESGVTFRSRGGKRGSGK